MRRAFLVLSIVCLAAIGDHAVAQYGVITGEQGVGTLDANGLPDTTSSPGEEIRVRCEAPVGTPCADAGALVTFDFSQSPGEVIGRMNADAAGRYDSIGLRMRIPTTARVGTATVSAITTLRGAPVTYSRAITIVAAAAPAPSPLPTTGRDVVVLVLWGFTLAAVGSILVVVTWRQWRQWRRRRAATRTDEPSTPSLEPAPTTTTSE